MNESVLALKSNSTQFQLRSINTIRGGVITYNFLNRFFSLCPQLPHKAVDVDFSVTGNEGASPANTSPTVHEHGGAATLVVCHSRVHERPETTGVRGDAVVVPHGEVEMVHNLCLAWLSRLVAAAAASTASLARTCI